jgi:hypothetical protein
MPILRAWRHSLLAAILLLTLNPFATAQQSGSRLPSGPSIRSTEPSRHDSPAAPVPPEPKGNPILGVLLILGVVGLFIVIAWLFSRIGEKDVRRSDGTLD